MKNKVNLFQNYCVKKFEHLPPQIVEVMKQVFTTCSILSIAILVLSCQKKDFLDVNPFNKINHNIATVSTPSVDTINQTLSFNLQESFSLLLNPGKGFIKYYNLEEQYSNIYTTKYVRFDWSDIQPTEANYNWNWIDSQIAECKAAGKKFAFGVMCANTNRSINTPDRGKYVTPKWVFTAGAKSRTINATYWETGQTIKQVVPVWTDAIFLAKLNSFVQALGARYNGNPDIAFVDIRSYGNWGEQHLYELGGTDITSTQLKVQHLQVYKNAFPNTQLITPWGEHAYDDTYLWGVNNGIGMRSDGIFKYSTGSEVSMAHGKVPTVFEYTAGYEWLTSTGYWNPDTLLRYIEIGKPSYIQFDNLMYEANKTLYTQIANRVGYHFVIKNVKVPIQIINGQTFNLETSILNKGVTNVYQNYKLAVALINSNGQVVQKKFLTDVNPKTWNSDVLNTHASQILFSDIATGNYQLALGLFSNQEDVNPSINFGNTQKTANGWFVVSTAINYHNYQ
jgi:hypothetical protein